jgi:hypothetical protein
LLRESDDKMAKDDIMEEIKKTLKEVAENQKRADKHLKRIDEEIDKLMMAQKKTDEQLKKTDEQLKRTDEQLKRTDEQVMRTSKKVDNLAELVGKMTNGWGKFVEGMIEPSCVKLAESLGIKVKKIHRRIEAYYGDEEIEADILIVGSSRDGKGRILVVEAKSHFEPDDMQYFLSWFVRFFEFFDEYKGYEVMGVVASPRFGNGVEKYAQRQGLWVLCASGDIMRLVNPKEFKPKILVFSE